MLALPLKYISNLTTTSVFPTIKFTQTTIISYLGCQKLPNEPHFYPAPFPKSILNFARVSLNKNLKWIMSFLCLIPLVALPLPQDESQ